MNVLAYVCTHVSACVRYRSGENNFFLRSVVLLVEHTDTCCLMFDLWFGDFLCWKWYRKELTMC